MVVYEITQDGLAPLLREPPAIDEELGAVLSKRTATQSVRLVHDHELGAKPPPVSSILINETAILLNNLTRLVNKDQGSG